MVDCTDARKFKLVAVPPSSEAVLVSIVRRDSNCSGAIVLIEVGNHLMLLWFHCPRPFVHGPCLKTEVGCLFGELSWEGGKGKQVRDTSNLHKRLLLLYLSQLYALTNLSHTFVASSAWTSFFLNAPRTVLLLFLYPSSSPLFPKATSVSSFRLPLPFVSPSSSSLSLSFSYSLTIVQLFI